MVLSLELADTTVMIRSIKRMFGIQTHLLPQIRMKLGKNIVIACGRETKSAYLKPRRRCYRDFYEM